ncbi:MAG: threonine aldolase family protein, partial [Pseudomonadota bacterium]
PYGAIFCHEESHVMLDECGAPELLSGGARLKPLSGANGKLTAETLTRALAQGRAGDIHHVQPAAISLTQATEAGTVYRPAELQAIAEVARRHQVRLHMDGARFANALVAQNASPADLTWRAGVDVLSFGASKNGAMAAEAAVFFDKSLAAEMAYRRKRGGHLFSKMRFLAAQFDAYFTDDLWLRHARHANAEAGRLAEGLAPLPGASLLHPVEANEVFIALPERVIAGLEQAGFQFYRWIEEGPGVIRLVTAFDTDPSHVTEFLKAAERLARG